jgi:anthranilate 1,2-dioxygenase small subunit
MRADDGTMDPQIQFVVERLISDYVHCIDDDRLEEWPGFFADPCLYKITTAENYERGLPIGVFFANSRGMLQDRVTALREANIYEPQRYRHLVSSTRILEQTDSRVRAESNFMVARIMQTGTTTLFATGRYLDQIAIDGPRPLFVEKIAVCDSRRIDTLLAIPL